MYVFDEYLDKHVVIITRDFSFEGILVEHNYHDEIHLFSYGHYMHCLLSTSDGIIEIPDKDILKIQIADE